MPRGSSEWPTSQAAWPGWLGSPCDLSVTSPHHPGQSMQAATAQCAACTPALCFLHMGSVSGQCSLSMHSTAYKRPSLPFSAPLMHPYGVANAGNSHVLRGTCAMNPMAAPGPWCRVLMEGDRYLWGGRWGYCRYRPCPGLGCCHSKMGNAIGYVASTSYLTGQPWTWAIGPCKPSAGAVRGAGGRELVDHLHFHFVLKIIHKHPLPLSRPLSPRPSDSRPRLTSAAP